MGMFRMKKCNTVFFSAVLLLFSTLAWSGADDFFILRYEVRRSQSGNNQAEIVLRHSGYAAQASFFDQNRICALFRDGSIECVSGRGSVRLEPGDNQVLTIPFDNSESPIKRIYLKD